MLLNHNDDFQSLSDRGARVGPCGALDAGQRHQPFDKAGYSTFIAESASIGNEMLLSDHLVAQARTPGEKLLLPGRSAGVDPHHLLPPGDVCRVSTRHARRSRSRPPAVGPALSDLYCSLVKRYYGEAAGVMNIDPAYCTEWAYVSHFYNGFYVWQYATSMVGAAEFTAAIQREGAPARDRFVRMLKAGWFELCV
jgi:oligoendopeptidase F